MRELLTKEQLQTIFKYLQDYSHLQAWRDLEDYCYSLKTIRMNGAFNRKDKEGVTIVLHAIEANIGSLSEFCKNHDLQPFSFNDNNMRSISQEVELVSDEVTSEVILEDKEPELQTIYYGTYDGINDSVGIFRGKDMLNITCIKNYTLYLDYKGETSNTITMSACNMDDIEHELQIVVDNSGKYIIETEGIIKNISKIVCEKNKAIFCELYAIYEIDNKE